MATASAAHLPESSLQGGKGKGEVPAQRHGAIPDGGRMAVEIGVYDAADNFRVDHRFQARFFPGGNLVRAAGDEDILPIPRLDAIVLPNKVTQLVEAGKAAIVE